jgi:hypothetical protein
MRLDAEIEEAMGHSGMANRLMQNLNDGIGEELFAMLAEILTDLDLGMKCQIIDLLYSRGLKLDVTRIYCEHFGILFPLSSICRGG